MSNQVRCLFDSSFSSYLYSVKETVLGEIVSHYNGNVPTTQLEAWEAEITIMRETIGQFEDQDGHIIFEYDIPRLGKRIDVRRLQLLLLRMGG